MIDFYSFSGGNLPLHDPSQQLDEGERIFREVDLPAKEGHAGSVLAGIMDELKRIKGCSRASAENPHDQFRVVGDQLLERPGTVVGDLEEDRPAD